MHLEVIRNLLARLQNLPLDEGYVAMDVGLLLEGGRTQHQFHVAQMRVLNLCHEVGVAQLHCALAVKRKGAENVVLARCKGNVNLVPLVRGLHPYGGALRTLRLKVIGVHVRLLKRDRRAADLQMHGEALCHGIAPVLHDGEAVEERGEIVGTCLLKLPRAAVHRLYRTRTAHVHERLLTEGTRLFKQDIGNFVAHGIRLSGFGMTGSLRHACRKFARGKISILQQSAQKAYTTECRPQDA